LLQFLQIAELPRAACSVQQKKFMLSGKPAFFPVSIKSANVADERSHAGYGTYQEMISTAALGIEHEPSFRNSSHEHFIAGLQSIQQRREIAGRYEFKKELEFVLVRRGHDRVRALPMLVGSFEAESCILARRELELAVRLDTDYPQLGGDVHALGDGCAMKFFCVAAAHGALCVSTNAVSVNAELA
jgi:hypothetical protein